MGKVLCSTIKTKINEDEKQNIMRKTKYTGIECNPQPFTRPWNHNWRKKNEV